MDRGGGLRSYLLYVVQSNFEFQLLKCLTNGLKSLMLFSFKKVPLHSNEWFNANRSYIAMQAQVGHMLNSCFVQTLSVQNSV